MQQLSDAMNFNFHQYNYNYIFLKVRQGAKVKTFQIHILWILNILQ